MNPPHIDYTERFGSLCDFKEPEYIGECALPICRHRDIYDNYEYFTDGIGHLFCTREHADLFYGIKCANN